MQKTQHQHSLVLIPHQVDEAVVQQRASDGYINATELCQAAGKRIGHYFENSTTKEFLRELSADVGIPTSVLVQVIKGGAGAQGTWVHPHVAIHFGQWLSPKFAVQVSKWVYDWMSGKGAPQAPTALPYHLERYVANDSKIPGGYFSILQETSLALTGPLHNLGFEIPKGWVPDISVGKLFCRWLRDHRGFDTNSLPTYEHDYMDGRPIVQANLYPDELLATYRNWFRLEWLPVNGVKYFKQKDPASLPYLDRLPALAAPVAKPALPVRKRSAVARRSAQ